MQEIGYSVPNNESELNLSSLSLFKYDRIYLYFFRKGV